MCAFLFGKNMSKFTLTDIQLEEAMSEIVFGRKVFFYKENVMGIRYPTSKELDGSKIVYIGKYKKIQSLGFKTREELKIFYIKNGILKKDFYVEIKKINDRAEVLYNARKKTGDAFQLIQIDNEIKMLYDRLYQMEIEESFYMTNSIEHGAEYSRLNYLISRCTMCGEELENRYWESYDSFKMDKDSELVRICRDNYRELKGGLDDKIIRAVARSREWRRRWEISKKTQTPVFDGVSANWDKNKVELCYWSNFYDNIFECLKIDDESVLEDDDKVFEMIRRHNAGIEKKSDSVGAETVAVKTPYRVRY